METINVVAKRTFRFTHPDYLSAEKRAQTIGLVEGRSIREMREVLGGSRAPSTAVMPGQILVKANPVEIQEVPAWITGDPLFGLAVKDGSIKMLRSDGAVSAKPNVPFATLETPPSIFESDPTREAAKDSAGESFEKPKAKDDDAGKDDSEPEQSKKKGK